MARKPSSTRPKSSVSVNFKGVESRTLFPEDDYRLKLDEIVHGTSGSGNEQLEFKFKIATGKFEGKGVSYYTPLVEQALWKLHNLLTVLGVDVPDDEMDLDFEEIVDNSEEIYGIISHETYEGQKRSKLVDFYAIDDAAGNGAEDDSEPEEEEKPAKSKKSSKKEEPEEEADDEEDDKAAKRKARRQARKARASEDDEDDKPARSSRKARDEEPEEEEEKPAKKSSKKKKGLTADDVFDKDEDELQELIEEHDLEVDLDDYKTLRKKANAVVDALEDAGLIIED